MDTSMTTFCRFSPLRTPNMKHTVMKKKHSKKFDIQDKNVSDTDSLASVVTSEIRELAHSVTKKLKNNSADGVISSDDDLFISQSKKVSTPENLVKKRHLSENDSSLSSSSSESEPDGIKSPTHKNQNMVSPKKRIRYDNGDTKSGKKSNEISSPKFQRKQNNGHDISESSESSSSDSDSSVGRKNSASSVLSSDSSKGRRGSDSSVESQSLFEGMEKSDTRSDDIDKQESDLDRNSKSSDNENGEQGIQSKTRKTTETKPKTVMNKECLSNESRELRFRIPDNFEVGASTNYLTKSDIQGKQLWLISAPDDFDISSLHRQKINVAGSSIVADENSETEKQFEVVGRPFTSQMSNYSSAALKVSGSDQFVLGSQLSGQLQIMDWIPCMPTVELVIQPQEKHRVPDNLKPTFVPFGAMSPCRLNEDENFDGHMKEKHKKKKKKKDKKKKK